MTLDEHRAKCIETMAIASANSGCTFPVWDTLSETSKEEYRREQAAAFDALPTAGVRVVPVEATEEMLQAGKELSYMEPVWQQQWRLWSAVGDLTNPPGGKT